MRAYACLWNSWVTNFRLTCNRYFSWNSTYFIDSKQSSVCDFIPFLLTATSSVLSDLIFSFFVICFIMGQFILSHRFVSVKWGSTLLCLPEAKQFGSLSRVDVPLLLLSCHFRSKRKLWNLCIKFTNEEGTPNNVVDEVDGNFICAALMLKFYRFSKPDKNFWKSKIQQHKDIVG